MSEVWLSWGRDARFETGHGLWSPGCSKKTSMSDGLCMRRGTKTLWVSDFELEVIVVEPCDDALRQSLNEVSTFVSGTTSV